MHRNAPHTCSTVLHARWMYCMYNITNNTRAGASTPQYLSTQAQIQDPDQIGSSCTKKCSCGSSSHSGCLTAEARCAYKPTHPNMASMTHMHGPRVPSCHMPPHTHAVGGRVTARVSSPPSTLRGRTGAYPPTPLSCMHGQHACHPISDGPSISRSRSRSKWHELASPGCSWPPLTASQQVQAHSQVQAPAHSHVQIFTDCIT